MHSVKNKGPLVFISYAREDRQRVIALGKVLRAHGLRTWIDIENIVPGERWEVAIESVLERADFVVICLSGNSVSKRSFAQREIKRTVRAEEQMLVDDIFLIPVRLESCELPVNLKDFQWVDAFTDAGFTEVTKAIAEGCRRRNLPLHLSGPEETEVIEAKDEMVGLDLSELGGSNFLGRFGLFKGQTK